MHGEDDGSSHQDAYRYACTGPHFDILQQRWHTFMLGVLWQCNKALICRCVELTGNDSQYLVIAWVTGKWHTLSIYRTLFWSHLQMFVHR